MFKHLLSLALGAAAVVLHNSHPELDIYVVGLLSALGVTAPSLLLSKPPFQK